MSLGGDVDNKIHWHNWWLITIAMPMNELERGKDFKFNSFKYNTLGFLIINNK